MPNQEKELPDELLRFSQQLERWRSGQPPRSRLPEAVWASAADMARRHGLHQTTKLLRLDYLKLKKRMASATPMAAAGPGFVELLGAIPAPAATECVVEWESARGRMRVAMKGVTPDWTSLLRALREG